MFYVIFSVILLYLLLAEFVIYKQIKKYIKPHRKKIFTIGYWSLMLIMLTVWLLVGFAGRTMGALSFEGVSQPFYFFFLSWHYGIFLTSLPYFSLLIIRFLFRKIKFYFTKNTTKRPTSHGQDSVGEEVPAGEEKDAKKTFSRREFFTKGANLALEALPLYASIGFLSGFYLGSREVITMRRQFTLKSLHDDLRGLKIVQISDIHIGMMINEKYLTHCAQMIRQLKPDLIIATGDIIDNSNHYLPVTGRFFQSIIEGTPYGGIGILGNHDFIDNPDVATRGFEQAQLKILRNSLTTLQRGKGRLQIVGLDYPFPMSRGSSQRSKKTQVYYSQATKYIREELPTLVLNHHPAEFDFFKTVKADLVLAGHTHGGQIITSHERESLLNFGSIGYKYYVDHYHENGRQLYVNRGLGHWFPLRINCPPEITFIELV